MILLIILFIISLIVISVNIIFLINFLSTGKPQASNSYFVYISVIVAFKNEENNLAPLISALQSLNYPNDKFEVLLLDDNSSDGSYQKAIDLSKNKINCRVLKADNKIYPGKRGALDVGIRSAKHSNILITDADCIPASNWLIGYSNKFNCGYDLLFGLAPFKKGKKIINKISCFENLRSSLLTLSFAKLKMPYSAAARNFGFTLEAYRRLGGFSKTLDTLSGDDDLLMREAAKSKLKVGIVDYKESYVLSETKSNLNDYLNQKARHTQTSLQYLLRHQILLGLWHSFNILLVLLLLFIPFYFFVIFPILIKLISDTVVVKLTQSKLKYNFNLVEILLLQIAYELFLILFFFLSFKKNIRWKD